jgi:uncharacterized protein
MTKQERKERRRSIRSFSTRSMKQHNTNTNNDDDTSMSSLSPRSATFSADGDSHGDEGGGGRSLRRNVSLKKMNGDEFIQTCAQTSSNAKHMRRQQSSSAIGRQAMSSSSSAGAGNVGLSLLPSGGTIEELLAEAVRRMKASDKRLRHMEKKLATAEDNEARFASQVKILKKEAQRAGAAAPAKGKRGSEPDAEKELRAQLLDMQEKYEELEARAESRVAQMGLLLKESEERANKARDTATRALNRIGKAEKAARDASQLVDRLRRRLAKYKAKLKSVDGLDDDVTEASEVAADALGGVDSSVLLELRQQLDEANEQIDKLQAALARERGRVSVLSVDRKTKARTEKIAQMTNNLLKTVQRGGVALPENMRALVQQLDDTLQQAIEAAERQQQREDAEGEAEGGDDDQAQKEAGSGAAMARSDGNADGGGDKKKKRGGGGHHHHGHHHKGGAKASASSSLSSPSAAAASSSSSSSAAAAAAAAWTGDPIAFVSDIAPPGFDAQREVLKVGVIEARGLRWTRVDPLVEVKLGDKSARTLALSKCSAPNGWHDTFVFGGDTFASAGAQLDVAVISGSDTLGTASLSLGSAMPKRGEKSERWLKLSGGSALDKKQRNTPAVYVSLLRTSYADEVQAASRSPAASSSSLALSPSASSSSSALLSSSSSASRKFNDSLHAMVSSMKRYDGADDDDGGAGADDVEPYDDPDWTPLQRAANALPRADLDKVATLLEATLDSGGSLDVTWANENDQNYVHLMCLRGESAAPLVERLLASKGAKEAAAATDCNGFVPFTVASAVGSVALLKLFVDKASVDVNLQMYNRTTALHHAALNGCSAAVAYLLEAGARVNHLDKNGASPLMKASFGGHLSVVEQLLQADAEVDLEDKDKNTAFLLAYLEGHFGAARVLRHAGACSPTMSNVVGDTPLWGVLVHFDQNVFDSFAKESGVDALQQRCGKHRHNVLHRAFLHLPEALCDRVVPLLVERGCSVSDGNGDGKTPLHLAARFNRVTLARFLIEHGASTSATDKADNTPLHMAAAASPELVALLVDAAGADGDKSAASQLVNAVNRQGNSALHVAFALQRFDIVAALRQRGADASVANAHGVLPHQCAWATAKILLPFYPDDEAEPSSAGLVLSTVNELL